MTFILFTLIFQCFEICARPHDSITSARFPGLPASGLEDMLRHVCAVRANHHRRKLMLPVTIENDALQIEVWPQIGGKVSSVIDKADGYDLLFNYPAELPTSAQYDIAYAKSWYAGWDECFPSVAASRYVGHPYDGIAVPDHGELWGIPTTSAIPTRDGITTVWHGLRFGYHFSRTLRLDGSSLVADYSLVNFAPFEFRYVWSMHALFSMESPAQLALPASASFRLDHEADGVEVQQPFSWPQVSSAIDLSHPSQLPENRAWKVFANNPISEPASINYASRRRTVSIEYIAEDGPAAYWGVWVNTGGRYRHRHFTIEPTMGRHDQIDRSIRDHSAGSVDPSGKREWTVRWTVGPKT